LIKHDRRDGFHGYREVIAGMASFAATHQSAFGDQIGKIARCRSIS
jgi:hypothetical protein